MNSLAAPLIPSNIGATPNPTQQLPGGQTALDADKSRPTSHTKEIRECLITIDLTCYWPNVFLSGYPERDGILHWTGCVWDKSILDNPWGGVPVCQRFVEDPNPLGGEGIAEILLGLAADKGYTHCEIRNYGMGTTDSYLDADAFALWYRGPIPPTVSSGL